MTIRSTTLAMFDVRLTGRYDAIRAIHAFLQGTAFLHGGRVNSWKVATGALCFSSLLWTGPAGTRLGAWGGASPRTPRRLELDLLEEW